MKNRNFATPLRLEEVPGKRRGLSVRRYRVQKKPMLIRHTGAVILLAVVISTVPFFQSRAAAQTSATLAGRIIDSSGGVLPGVTVTVRQTATGLQRGTVSDTQGRYTVAALPPGSYEIRAELSGFRPLQRSGVTLTIAQTAVVDLTLTVGGVAEEVTVVGDTSAVSTRTGELSYLVEQRAIEDLPLNGRNYTDLALLQPGVVPRRTPCAVGNRGVADARDGH